MTTEPEEAKHTMDADEEAAAYAEAASETTMTASLIAKNKDAVEREPLKEVDASFENNHADDSSDIDKTPAEPSTAPEKKKMETFEIEQPKDDGTPPSLLQTVSEDIDDLDEEAQGLLAEAPKSSSGANSSCCLYCGPTETIGAYTVFCPKLFAQKGWGIMGVHWFGPPCVTAVIVSASSFFIQHGWTKVGPITGVVCILWTVQILYGLFNTAYRDPGIVRKDQETPTKHHRWCELCKNYQPPKGAHCPDCNVCIAGFDQYVMGYSRRMVFLHFAGPRTVTYSICAF